MSGADSISVVPFAEMDFVLKRLKTKVQRLVVTFPLFQHSTQCHGFQVCAVADCSPTSHTEPNIQILLPALAIVVCFRLIHSKSCSSSIFRCFRA